MKANKDLSRDEDQFGLALKVIIDEIAKDVIRKAEIELYERTEKAISDMAIRISSNRKIEQRGNEIAISFTLSDSTIMEMRG